MTYIVYKTGVNSRAHYSKKNKEEKKQRMALIKVGPSGEPIATPSFCLHKPWISNKSNKPLKVCQLRQDP